MKKVLFTLIFVIFNISFANAEVTHPFSNGNTLPNGRCSFGTTNCAGGGKHHLGVDLMGKKDSKVVSMCPGTVKHNNTQTRDIWNSKVIIKHDCNGKTVYGIYGHILSYLSPEDSILRGETVGTLKDDGNNSHLHMGVSKKYSTTKWGYGTKSDVNNTFLDFKEVLNYPPIISNKNASIFDGAGSIIKPDGDCYGCQHDVADMQRHNIPSTVVFQWKSEATCTSLKIGVQAINSELRWVAGDEPLDVVIHTKAWNTDKSIAYKATLPLTVDSENTWNTTAVTSQKKLSKMTRIMAKCEKYMSIGGNRSSINEDMVNLSGNYFWAGNGSVITRALDNNTTGKTQDWAITFDSNKAITAFQWDVSASCSSLHLESNWYGEDGEVPVVQVDMKGWSTESWPNNHLCSGKLPCDIDAPSINYYIVKIKTKDGAIPSGRIHASCN